MTQRLSDSSSACAKARAKARGPQRREKADAEILQAATLTCRGSVICPESMELQHTLLFCFEVVVRKVNARRFGSA